MWYNWNSRVLLLELKNGTATMENSLVDSQKVKHSITKWPIIKFCSWVLHPGELKADDQPSACTDGTCSQTVHQQMNG